MDGALREFHVSRQARDKYQFDETFFSLRGDVLFANFHAARRFAQQMNERRDLVNYPEHAVRAGELNAMGLMDEIFHYIIRLYHQQRNPHAMAEALAYLETQLGREAVDEVLRAFVDNFPPVAVYRGEMSAEAYLSGETEGVPHRQVVLEELLLLWLANQNPALSTYVELFDDETLARHTAYPQVVNLLRAYFEAQPHFGPDHESLVDMLRRPARMVPHSIHGQLEYIRTHWAALLGDFLYRLLSSLDLLAEEEKAFFGFGPGPAEVYEFGALEPEPENFSPDRDWMPRLILIAKNTYVWLDQLSKKYGRPITRLDQIPDEELDTLARWGFTGLWLIGLWQRSKASRRIKQMMGNPDAVASAYSLDEYRVADDLGGEAAYENLKARAWQRGIRLATDMVPNHVGIDARWVIEHPDWFIHLDYSPFPSYTFNGPDLCDHPDVGIFLEDHYYTRTDAAVVFKRVDYRTGDVKYIYHGNDGTSMPWNDTAQLNYLKPEVREAVIQTILDVARRSPIIRFDAAMTLTKRHYHRLWFPEPGTGGDIPSRADFGMTKAEFDKAMPNEFWREVVDRVAQEAPDTLLLAEAFWLMEGYFVRTLGMHRVYNSAFMNMMRDEKNAEYRRLMKNTLEFDPRILKRYVNFMNNPDERTAVDQFGKGDKYFGICTVMVTMPGLPMFGHGQIEGYAEKYGMEFRRAYWNEQPDPWLVARHERQIFPLLHKRYLFAEVDNFLLYDFFTPEGVVDENVFAYSNRYGDERALVLYHNRYAETRGWIRVSAAYAVKDADGEKRLVQRTLAEGLAIPPDPDAYLIFRDAVSGLEYIRNCRELTERGLYAHLHAYEVLVFLDFRLVHDDADKRYARLAAHLAGRGVPSIEGAMRELLLAPVYAPFRRLISAETFRRLMALRNAPPSTLTPVLDKVEADLRDLLRAVQQVAGGGGNVSAIAREARREIEVLLRLPAILDTHRPADERKAAYNRAADYLLNGLEEGGDAAWGAMLSCCVVRALGRAVREDEAEAAALSRSWLDAWWLGRHIADAMRNLGLDEGIAHRAVAVVRLVLDHRRWWPSDTAPLYPALRAALGDRQVQAYLGVNRYQDILWFNKEAFEQWVWWLAISETTRRLLREEGDFADALIAIHRRVRHLLAAEQASGYRVLDLLEATRTLEGRA